MHPAIIVLIGTIAICFSAMLSMFLADGSFRLLEWAKTKSKSTLLLTRCGLGALAFALVYGFCFSQYWGYTARQERLENNCCPEKTIE